MKVLNDGGGVFFDKYLQTKHNTYNHKLLMVKVSNTTPLPLRIFWGGV